MDAGCGGFFFEFWGVAEIPVLLDLVWFGWNESF